MRRPNLLALGLWAGATCVATAVCWAGVAAVTTDVTGDHGVALPRARVAQLATEARPTTTVAAASATTSTTSTTAAPTTTTTPPPVVAAAAEVTSATTSTSTTSTTVPSRSATFADEGGVIVVACEGDAASLTSARPSDGYALEVKTSGPDLVKVAFTSDTDRSMLAARCMDGTPTEVVAQQQPPEHPRRQRFSGAESAPPKEWAPRPRS